jgi:hypothetical protein
VPPTIAIAEDNCNLVADIFDNPADLGIYKGASDRSRVLFPETEFCVIKKSSFYCSWPTSKEAGTKARFDKLVGALSTCKNFGALTANPPGSAAESSYVTNLEVPDRGNIKIKMESLNPPESSADWKLTLEIDPKAPQ